ncbi:MarR family winged helix-turn-helix transcriptional regulator [Streptomyces hoynatensis]|uniref:MarR family transcriptional regulator n=1 Tax=Streptomyces hoynatensis TaxID=1141874 RepID=A0A3A9ZBI1_9ACTN|nr:MarR family transcriptional regulator [Streptomyces hoynatensis]RKN44736.1 MarR family transcriptional regulator [Streptomyces hoynatensis]
MSDLLRLFTRAHKLLRAASDEAMSRHGVRVGQNLLLEVLWETDGLTPGELAQRLRVATPTIVKSTARMEAAGLLTKRRDPADARLVRLHLTERGRAAREPVQAARAELERHATATLTAEERRVLRVALTKIVDRMEAAAGGETDSMKRAEVGHNDVGAPAPHPPERPSSR